MLSAKEIRNKCAKTKREEVKQVIIDAVQDEFEGKALCRNIAYVYYMDDILQKELEEAGYTVEQKREKFLSSEVYWEIRWYL
jgi:ribosomal protein S24E